MSNDTGIEEQILAAAHQVFLEKGLETSRMQDIVERAGISRTVLNYYFRTKDKLYHKVAASILQQAIPNVLKILNSDLPFEDKIRRFVEFYIPLIMRNPFVPLFVINEVHRLGPEFMQTFIEGHKCELQRFLQHVQEEMNAGRIAKAQPLQIYINLMSLCVFPVLAKPMIMIMSGSTKEEIDAIMQERITYVADFALKGMRP